jgi:hypothetical protein
MADASSVLFLEAVGLQNGQGEELVDRNLHFSSVSVSGVAPVCSRNEQVLHILQPAGEQSAEGVSQRTLVGTFLIPCVV